MCDERRGARLRAAPRTRGRRRPGATACTGAVQLGVCGAAPAQTWRPQKSSKSSTTGRRSRRRDGGSGSSPGRARRSGSGGSTVSPETCHAAGWSFGTIDWSGLGILVVAVVDDEVDRRAGVDPATGRAAPARRRRSRRCRRTGAATSHSVPVAGGDAVAPQVQAPAVVDAVGAAVVDRDEPVGGGLRRVDRRVAGLQPDLRRLRRVELRAVGVGVASPCRCATTKSDVVGAGLELDPGEAPVVVLADERAPRSVPSPARSPLASSVQPS